MGFEDFQGSEVPDKEREAILYKVRAYFAEVLDDLEGSEKYDDEEVAKKAQVEGIIDDMSHENFESASQYLEGEVGRLSELLKKDRDAESVAILEVRRATVQGLLESLSLKEI